MMQNEEYKHLRRNIAVTISEGSLFGFGIGIASFTTVIPLFVSQMTDSAILIGLITAVHIMGWQVPQLLMARSVSRLKRYKPMVMAMTIHERLPFLGLALIAFFYNQLGPLAAIILTFMMLIWQGFGAGFTANAWQNMIGKVIPPENLATVFGLQSSAFNLLSAGAAIIAGLALERQPFPINYGLCFLGAFIALVISFFVLGLTREFDHEVTEETKAPPPLLHSIGEILRRDHNFRWFLGARTLVQFGTMAFSFYTVYAASRLLAGPYSIGVLTSVLFFAQVIFNPLFGWIADRWSRKGVLEIGALSIFLSAIIARYAPTVAWMYPSVILAALANTAFWSITMAMTLQFGEERERPTYVGMANTLIAPATIIAPLAGGWLADAQGYDATFLLAATAGLLSVLVFHFFVKDPQRRARTSATVWQD